jgi:hypothetical protein
MHFSHHPGKWQIMNADKTLNEPELREKLREFLEKYLSVKILDSSVQSLKMYMLHAKNTRKTKPFEKLILYKLARLQERLIEQSGSLNTKDLIICEFLTDELKKYISGAYK